VLLFNFGKKHFRKPVMLVMEEDPGYLRWMLKAGFPEDVCQQVREIQRQYKDELKKKIQLETGNLPFGG